ncbi:glycine--tRNA ligase subunit beta [Candidatus Dojkabacteria bacterium]|nr:glycine--tRNA ligase subunit beta [Candidatus Dojkabacteria bacterium]
MDYIVEFGVEEIPAKACDSARRQLKGGVLQRLLTKYNISTTGTEVYVTPRRIAVIIKGLDISTDNKFVVGPLIKDSITEGRINERGKKFALSYGISLRKLKKTEINGKKYLAIPKDIKQILSEKLESLSTDIIKSLSFQHMMIWKEGGIKFIRPIRWITTVLDTVPVTFTFAGVTASTLSYGARFSGGVKVRIKTPREYAKTLRTYDVVVDVSERKQLICSQIDEIEKKRKVKVNVDLNLLDTVTDLVEFPIVIMGEFDQRFLKLPSEVVTQVLSHHQKAFSVKKDGKPAAYFVAVMNQKKENQKEITAGYEKIINARLSDAEFYYTADRSKSIDDFKSKTKDIIIHEKIGNIPDVVMKMQKAVGRINKIFKLPEKNLIVCKNALDISLFDLGTQVVTEFNSLQGKIGSIYAKQRKVPATVANIIEDMTYPRFSGDRLPETKEGVFCSFLYKWVMLNEYLKAGFEIKGNYDPVGIRRLVAGLVELVIGKEIDVTLADLLTDVKPEYLKSLIETRVTTYWKGLGISTNLINQNLKQLDKVSIISANKTTLALAELHDKASGWFSDLREVVKRVNNVIERSNVKPAENFSAADIKNPETKKLYSIIRGVKIDKSDIVNYYWNLSKLTPEINNYFNKVMVVDKDKKIAVQNVTVLNEFRMLVKDLLG